MRRCSQRWAQRRRKPVTLDGEIVALDAEGRPAGFQQLQGRIHLRGRAVASGPTAFMLFDVLRVGERDLRNEALTVRRVSLESLFARSRSPLLRVSEQVAGDGRALYSRALESGWEGLIAKHAASKYRSGKRSPDWRKLKIIQEQAFVIAGWTDPRQTRTHFGALLLGVYEGDALVYAGHVGTGFDEKALARVTERMEPLQTRTCPFAVKPASNERPHWVRPELVAQIKFSEWTEDNHLRHPVFIGLRDDTPPPSAVVRERTTRLHGSATRRLRATTDVVSGFSRTNVVSGFSRTRPEDAGIVSLIDQIRALEDARRDGVLQLPDGDTLSVTNLHKVFWPQLGLTKGDLFR